MASFGPLYKCGDVVSENEQANELERINRDWQNPSTWRERKYIKI